MEVHRVPKNGFVEPVYQEALAIELGDRQILFQKEKSLDIFYKGHTLACKYRADFVCFNDLLVEINAINQLSSNEQAQVINYLKATDMTRSLLINFGQKSLRHRRIARSN